MLSDVVRQMNHFLSRLCNALYIGIWLVANMYLEIQNNINLMLQKKFPPPETLVLSLPNSKKLWLRQKTVLKEVRGLHKVTKGSKVTMDTFIKEGNMVILG